MTELCCCDGMYTRRSRVVRLLMSMVAYLVGTHTHFCSLLLYPVAVQDGNGAGYRCAAAQRAQQPSQARPGRRSAAAGRWAAAASGVACGGDVAVRPLRQPITLHAPGSSQHTVCGGQ